MKQILVRNLPEKTLRQLKLRAKQNGRSLQAEVKIILEDAAHVYTPKMSVAEARASILELREKLKGRKFPDSVTLIREDRDR